MATQLGADLLSPTLRANIMKPAKIEDQNLTIYSQFSISDLQLNITCTGNYVVTKLLMKQNIDQRSFTKFCDTKSSKKPY